MSVNMQSAKKTFGASVREHRLALHLSQEDLAARADMHRTYITDVERGVRNVTLASMCKLAEALGIPLEALVTGVTCERESGPSGKARGTI
jgi:transcriptional regulator with XRE-family HTH domain